MRVFAAKRRWVLGLVLLLGASGACNSSSSEASRPETTAVETSSPSDTEPERSASDESGRFTATFLPAGLQRLFVHDNAYDNNQGVYQEAYGAGPGAPVDVYIQTIRSAKPVRADEMAEALGVPTERVSVKGYEGVKFESPDGYRHVVWVENDRLKVSVLGWQQSDEQLLEIAAGLVPG